MIVLRSALHTVDTPIKERPGSENLGLNAFSAGNLKASIGRDLNPCAASEKNKIKNLKKNDDFSMIVLRSALHTVDTPV